MTSDAQGPVLRQFTAEDGLPGSMVYCSMQDKNGYIWSGTDRGVTRFDGHQFELFTIKDGLTSNEVWQINEDKQGRLWMNTFAGVCYFENETIKTLKRSKLPSKIGKVNHHMNALGHFISIANQTFLLDDRDSLFQLNSRDRFFISNGMLTYETKHTAPFFQEIRTRLKTSPQDSLVVLNQVAFSNKKQAIKSIKAMESIDLEASLLINQHSIAFLIKGQLWLADKKKDSLEAIDLSKLWEKQKNNPIRRILKFAPNKIWIKTETKDYVVDTLWQPLPNFDFLSDLSINHILSDDQDNLWISSVNGLFFLSRKAQLSKTYLPKGGKTQENVNFLAINKKKEIWGIGTEGYLYRLFLEKELRTVSKNALAQHTNDLAFAPNGDLWIGADRLRIIAQQDLMRYATKIEEIAMTTYPRSLAIKKIHFDTQGKPVLAIHNTVFHVDQEAKNPLRKLYEGRFYDIASLENGNYWLTGKNGLKLISSTGQDLSIPSQSPLLELPINNIAVGKDQKLWFAVNSRGVYRLDQKGRLDSIPELKEVLVQSLHVDLKERLWIASNRGIAKIDLLQSDALKYTIQWLTEISGLASNDVKEILIDDNQIYAATEKGLTVLPDLPRNEQLDQAPFHFSKLWINDRDTAIYASYELSHRQNSLIIEYQSLDYQNMGRMVFQYRLEGIDDNWINTRAFKKEYPLLPPGAYTFRLRKKPTPSDPIPSELVMHFNIHSAWWNSLSFILFCSALLGYLLYLIMQWRIQKVNKRTEEKNKLHRKFAELELNALQAQMNPHFVFNALQAIQGHIFKQDVKVANRYIVKFSRLMRLFLESSKEKYIILEQEIQLLQFYIELELLRFKDKFTFEIKLAEDLTPSMIEIPSVLLQPFVENAINHGLIHRQTPGKLLLEFTKKEEKLHCRIEDNGIGRKKAMQIKEQSIKSYKSRGMQLVEERQRVWNIIGNDPVDISIQDLYNEAGIAIGTRIDLYINIAK